MVHLRASHFLACIIPIHLCVVNSLYVFDKHSNSPLCFVPLGEQVFP